MFSSSLLVVVLWRIAQAAAEYDRNGTVAVARDHTNHCSSYNIISCCRRTGGWYSLISRSEIIWFYYTFVNVADPSFRGRGFALRNRLRAGRQTRRKRNRGRSTYYTSCVLVRQWYPLFISFFLLHLFYNNFLVFTRPVIAAVVAVIIIIVIV